jgi:hypothetical protein
MRKFAYRKNKCARGHAMEEKTSSYKIKCNVCGLKEEKN